MKSLRKILSDYLGMLVLSSFFAVMFREHLGKLTFTLPPLLSLAGISGDFGEPGGYLVRAAGFSLTALAVFFFGSPSWITRFAFGFFIWMAVAYVVSYPLYRRGNNFLPRNMLAIMLLGLTVSFTATYPPNSRRVLYLLDLLLVVGLLSVAVLIGNYLSARIYLRKNIAVELQVKDVGQRDLWLVKMEPLVREFVEKGNKGSLIVFISRNAPWNVSDEAVSKALKPILDYNPDVGGYLTPTWLRILYEQRERIRRKELLQKVLEQISRW